MTTAPHTIGADQTLSKAHAMMREHSIRHLPVLSGGKLVGVLTDRDLRLVESLKDVDPAKLMVEEAMTSDVFVVEPDMSLDEVVGTMGSKKIGSVVVMQNQKVVGIFTTVDVCRAFAEMLHTRLAK
ncbi:MAG: CBS domain-containing protein [Deltaproteobacteria bacterium]|nr:CBS domain-containing protein [Deltaproteobacteria bacterium]